MDNLSKPSFRVREYSISNDNNIIVSLLLGIALVCGVIVLFLLFDFNLINEILIVLVALLLYIVLLFSLIEPSRVREIRRNIVTTVEKPVVKEVIKEVEKPVIRKVIVEKPVVKRVYIEKKHKKLNIPHYEYIGSMQTRTYHLRACRLGKLVKKKYQLSNNSLDFFKKRKFKPCKICILKQRKV